MGRLVRMNGIQGGQKLRVDEIGSRGLAGACPLHARCKDVCIVTIHYVSSPMCLGYAELWSVGSKKRFNSKQFIMQQPCVSRQLWSTHCMREHFGELFLRALHFHSEEDKTS